MLSDVRTKRDKMRSIFAFSDSNFAISSGASMPIYIRLIVSPPLGQRLSYRGPQRIGGICGLGQTLGERHVSQRYQREHHGHRDAQDRRDGLHRACVAIQPIPHDCAL
jgi:hypothetical protein